MSDYIPQELLIEILVRLPVRSLLQFRCVSKLWYSLISSSIFISAHTNFINNHHHHHHHHNHPDLLLVNHFHDIRGQGYFSLRFDDKSFHEFQEFDVPYNPDFRIVGFCNGLLCSTKETIYNLSSGSSGITVLHNPIIKDTLTLPPPTISPHCHSPPAFGFGFDSKRNDYKVVRIVEDCHNFSPVEVEVFELKTGSWRILADVIVPTVSILFLVGTFFNGGLHWIGENPTRKGNLHQKSILLFDLCREAFQEMKLPNCLASKSTTNLFTGVCQEKLCLVQYNRFMDDPGYQDLWLAKTCSIWVMKEYGVENSWTKLFNIGLREWGIPTAKVLGFRRHGDVVIEADGEVLVYDPKKERPNYLGIVARRGTFYVGDYEESLVFLGGDGGGVQS